MTAHDNHASVNPHAHSRMSLTFSFFALGSVGVDDGPAAAAWAEALSAAADVPAPLDVFAGGGAPPLGARGMSVQQAGWQGGWALVARGLVRKLRCKSGDDAVVLYLQKPYIQTDVL